MKAVVVFEPGDVHVLQMCQRPKPKVKKGWSLIKVMGFGINRSEIFTRQGLSPNVSFPRILGIECAGMIEETTDRLRLPIGQTVISIMGEMGRDFDGSYAEYVLLPNEQIYPIETSMDWKMLATIPETYYTAYGAFKNLQIDPSDTILVRGGASGVGTAFVHLVKARFPDLTVFASVRKPGKEEALKRAGYDGVVWDKQGQLECSQVFSKILELVGPAAIKDSLKHLQEHGILCSCGQLGGQWVLDDFDPIAELKNNVYLTTFYSGNVNQEKIQEMLDYIQSFAVDIQPEKVFDSDEIQKAHAYLEGKEAFGKVIVLNGEKTNGSH